MEITIGRDAPARLAAYAARRGLSDFVLAADDNTYAALGERAETALRDAGLAVTPVILGGEPVLADELRLVQLLSRAPAQETCYLAVGSGTITDITRFASYRSRNRFIALPTAPSMDGYATTNNTLTLGGLKLSMPGHAPEAIFCDLDALCAAPRPMIAAGLGDTLAKFTSVNDLRLGHLLWDEPWDDRIGDRMEALAREGLGRAASISGADPEAVSFLMRALLDSGLAMGAFGSSMPGAGAEHHTSHCWEMRHQEGPQLLHGAKVGVGTVMAAGWYAAIRRMERAEAARRLAAFGPPDPDAEEAAIRHVYGRVGEEIIARQRPFLRMREEARAALLERIVDCWDQVRAIAARIPAPDTLAAALHGAGGPGTPEALGLPPGEIAVAARYGLYTRPRFTVARLRLMLGI